MLAQDARQSAQNTYAAARRNAPTDAVRKLDDSVVVKAAGGMKRRVMLVCLLVLTVGVVGASASLAQAAVIGPITISSNADFTRVDAASGCACVTGTDAGGVDVIANWDITANGVPGVKIVSNSGSITQPFRLDHIAVHTSGNAPGILLQNLTSRASITYPNIGTPPSTPLAAGNTGIEIANAPGVTVTGGSVNNLGDWGIRVRSSPYVTLNGVQVSHTGLINPNSESTPGLAYNDQNPWLGGLIGHAPGGIVIIDSHDDSLINVAAGADAYAGVELVRSSHNTLNGVDAHYPDYYGLALQSSNSNTITNGKFGASDYNDVLLRSSSYNVITNNTLNAAGPIGAEFPKGIVGYFSSALYVGWGSANNVIKGNGGKNSFPSVEIDDGHVPPFSLPSAQGALQIHNPLNDQTTGGDPASYQALIASGGGAEWAGAMTTTPLAGPESQTQVCGNSFTGLGPYTPGLDPNAAC
jgi:hypothetical protein